SSSMSGTRNVQVHAADESSSSAVNRRVSEIGRAAQRHNNPCGDKKSGKTMVESQLLVIGGYVPGPHGLDSIIVGYYKGDDLVYVARVRNGFVPASRRQVFEKLRTHTIPECPFVNLPEKHRSRWGDGLTADDMKKCVHLFDFDRSHRLSHRLEAGGIHT